MRKAPPQGRWLARWRDRYFILSGRLLVYFKSATSKVSSYALHLFHTYIHTYIYTYTYKCTYLDLPLYLVYTRKYIACIPWPGRYICQTHVQDETRIYMRIHSEVQLTCVVWQVDCRITTIDGLIDIALDPNLKTNNLFFVCVFFLNKHNLSIN
jgi:hypothetical protein